MIKDKGFTLIELLVVVAIIGILSSVVITNLNNARLKAKDSALASELSSMRAEAELVASQDAEGDYSSTCTIGQNSKKIYDSANLKGKGANATARGLCLATTTAWAAWVTLNAPASSTQPIYCVDTYGYSGPAASGAVSANDYICN